MELEKADREGTCQPVIQHIGNNISPHQHIPNRALWKLTNHGRFTCSLASEEIMNERVMNQCNSFLWHKKIPFKSLFLLWRTLRGKVPTNENLISLALTNYIVFVFLIEQVWTT